MTGGREGLSARMVAALRLHEKCRLLTWESLHAAAHTYELRENAPDGRTIKALLRRGLLDQLMVKDANGAFITWAFHLTDEGKRVVEAHP